MARYELSNAADRDLTDIYIYSYQQFGEAAADRYFSDLEACFTRLSEFPRLGRSIDQIRPGYFRFEHQSHTVFYMLTDFGVRIVRVLHEAMDPERHL